MGTPRTGLETLSGSALRHRLAAASACPITATSALTAQHANSAATRTIFTTARASKHALPGTHQLELATSSGIAWPHRLAGVRQCPTIVTSAPTAPPVNFVAIRTTYTRASVSKHVPQGTHQLERASSVACASPQCWMGRALPCETTATRASTLQPAVSAAMRTTFTMEPVLRHVPLEPPQRDLETSSGFASRLHKGPAWHFKTIATSAATRTRADFAETRITSTTVLVLHRVRLERRVSGPETSSEHVRQMDCAPRRRTTATNALMRQLVGCAAIHTTSTRGSAFRSAHSAEFRSGQGNIAEFVPLQRCDQRILIKDQSQPHQTLAVRQCELSQDFVEKSTLLDVQAQPPESPTRRYRREQKADRVCHSQEQRPVYIAIRNP